MAPEPENKLTLEERLRAHPELRAHMERLLDEVENRGGQLNTADEAEDALVERMRAMGREALREWAQQRQEQVQPDWERGRNGVRPIYAYSGLLCSIRFFPMFFVARRLRIQYPGATYHVINRGNYRADVFGSVGAAKAFEQVLGEACEMFGWVVAAYVLMRNHFHLALETPEPNLVE